MKYRNFDFYNNEEILDERPNELYVKKNDIDDILDDIETKVNSIKDDLENYIRIDDINNILEKLNKLSDDLY